MSKGIYRDSPGIIPEGFGRYNRNVVLNKEGKFVTNEYGFQETLELLGVIFLGSIETYKETVAFYVDEEGENPKSYILRIDQSVEVIIADSSLGFKKENPIEGVFQYSQNGDLIIAWWDGVSSTSNTPKILDIDCLPFELNNDKSLVNPDDINLIQLFPLFSTPEILSIDERPNTGVLKTGAYHIFTYYELSDGDKVGYAFTGNAYYLHNSSVEIYDEIEGSDGDITTTKSLVVTIHDVDQVFTKVGIGVAHVANGVTRFYDYGSQEISGDTKVFTLNGDPKAEVTLESISNSRAYYDKVATGTVVNNRLYLGNFKTDELANLQQYFTDANLEWVYNDNQVTNLESIPRSTKDSEAMFFAKTFLPDEVYALYAKVLYKTGEIAVFPFVGREKRDGITWENTSDETFPAGGVSSDLVVNEDDLIIDIVESVRDSNPSNNINNLEQALNINTGLKVFHVLDTSDSDGTLGYWEQGNEVYPQCYGDLAGKPVRYVKMPSLEALKKYKVAAGEEDIFFRKGAIKGELLNVIYLQDDNMIDNFAGSARGRVYDFEVTEISFAGQNSAAGSIVPIDLDNIITDPDVPDYNTDNIDEIFYKNGYQPYTNQIVDVLVEWNRPKDFGLITHVAIVILDSLGNVVDVPYHNETTVHGSPDISGNLTYFGSELIQNISLQAGQILAYVISEAGIWYQHPVAARGYVNVSINVHEDLSSGSNVYARQLGIKVTNLNLPVEEQAKIDHIELCYAKRGDFNSLVKGMSIITTSQLTGHEVESVSGNIRFHSFEMLKDKPTLLSYIKTHFKGLPNSSVLTNGELFDGVDEDIDADNYRGLRAIINKYYIPENVVGNIDNTNREEALILNITGLLENMSSDPDYNFVFATVFGHLDNVYDGLEENTLVRTGSKIIPSLTEITSYGGDGFITPYSFKFHTNAENDMHVYYFPVYSRVNIALREEGDNEWELVYPFTADPTDYNPELAAPDGDRRQHGNYIKYNTDFNALLDFEGLNIYIKRCTGDCNDEITSFPYRVHRSVKYGNESNVIRWRNFLLDDYYEMPRESGEIIALNNLDDSLVVHMRNDLYIAQNKDTLRTDDLTISLGDSDIFTTEPKRIIFGGDGYLGCVNKWSICIHKGMYVFVNTIRGRAFLLDKGGVIEVSDMGLFTEFRDNFKDIMDNPFAYNGIVTGYDIDHDRFLITKVIRNLDRSINTEKSVTYSLYPKGVNNEPQWLSDHDFHPSAYWQRDGEMYAVVQSEDGFRVYLMNHKENLGNFTGEVKNSFIEVCIYTKTGENWETIAWKTLVKDLLGKYIDDTFDQIFVRNDHQATKVLDITPKGLTKLSTNTKRIKDYYYFNQISDSKVDAIGEVVDSNGNVIVAELKNSIAGFNKRKLRSDYIIVRLIFDNTKNRSFYLMDVKAE